MEPTHFANQHNGVPGAGLRNKNNDSPDTMTVQQALDDPATSQYAPRSSESVAAPGSDYNISNYYPPTTTGSHPTTDHDLAARAAVSAQTELGSPQNRIPTREDTQRQLAAIQASELPVGASRTSAEGGVFPPSSDIGYDTYRDGDYNGHVKSSNKAYTNVRCQTEKEDDGMVSASLRQHRKSNYAPGYKAAGEAVPERSYIAEGHNAVSFPHEQLFGSEQQQGTGAVGGGTTTTADQGRDVPPPLPPRTHGIDYASSSGNPTTYGAATAGAGTGNSHANTGRNSPGASLGSKVQGVLAQVHGATEIVRGNMRAAIDHAAGDEARQAEDEQILRQGQREYTTRKMDRAQQYPRMYPR